MQHVAIFLFPDVELLDFAGPLEVFSTVNKLHGGTFLSIETVAEKPGPVRTAQGIEVIPSHTFGTAHKPDLLIIPGGQGTRREMHSETVHRWIRSRWEGLHRMLTVCTGALIPARMGLLDGLKVTTHTAVMELLRTTAPAAQVVEGVRYTDNGKVITSAGVASGLDAALHVVEKMYGRKVALETAEYIEYPGYR